MKISSGLPYYFIYFSLTILDDLLRWILTKKYSQSIEIDTWICQGSATDGGMVTGCDRKGGGELPRRLPLSTSMHPSSLRFKRKTSLTTDKDVDLDFKKLSLSKTKCVYLYQSPRQRMSRRMVTFLHHLLPLSPFPKRNDVSLYRSETQGRQSGEVIGQKKKKKRKRTRHLRMLSSHTF